MKDESDVDEERRVAWERGSGSYELLLPTGATTFLTGTLGRRGRRTALPTFAPPLMSQSVGIIFM